MPRVISIDKLGSDDYDVYGARKELRLNHNEVLVGMSSCLKPQKFPQNFIKLTSLINKTAPAVRFILIGDGIRRERIEGLLCHWQSRRPLRIAEELWQEGA
jgi:hypothetical protein